MRKQNGERKCSSMCCYALCFNLTQEILQNQHWYAHDREIMEPVYRWLVWRWGENPPGSRLARINWNNFLIWNVAEMVWHQIKKKYEILLEMGFQHLCCCSFTTIPDMTLSSNGRGSKAVWAMTLTLKLTPVRVWMDSWNVLHRVSCSDQIRVLV